jgi:hypothetical protein
MTSFRTRARGRVDREWRDGRTFVSDLWRTSSLRRNHWYVIGDSHGYVLRGAHNVVLRLRPVSLYRAGRPGEAKALLKWALRWMETQDTILGTVAEAIGARHDFPTPTEDDVVVLSLGAVDIRTHIQGQIVEMKRPIDDVIGELAGSTIRCMEEVQTVVPSRTVLLSIAPPGRRSVKPTYAENGSLIERATWTRDLNDRIAAILAERSFERVAFAEYWSQVVTPEGILRPELTRDEIHLRRSCFPIVHAAVRRAVAQLSDSST